MSGSSRVACADRRLRKQKTRALRESPGTRASVEAALLRPRRKPLSMRVCGPLLTQRKRHERDIALRAEVR
jgi:hypothetical protein